MAKRSRRPVRPDALTPTTSESPASSTSSTRSTRTPRPRRAVAQPSFFEQYRTLIYGGAALIGVLIIGWLFLAGATHAAYTCDAELSPAPSETLVAALPTATPSPTPSASPTATITAAPSTTAAPSSSAGASGSPSATATAAPTTAPTATDTGSPSPSASPTTPATPVPAPTARLGFSVPLQGRTHVVDLNTVINYALCPPTSGSHYNIPNHGPIRPDVYPANQEQVPGGWVHNLEHGYVVALYRCPSGVLGQGDCISQAEFDQMTAFFNAVPHTTAPALAACPTKVVVARFDSMDTKFALLAWGRALLTDTFDLDTALLFDQQWQDQPAAPEFLC